MPPELCLIFNHNYKNAIQGKAVMYSKRWRDLKERQGRKVVSFPSLGQTTESSAWNFKVLCFIDSCGANLALQTQTLVTELGGKQHSPLIKDLIACNIYV